MLNFGHGNRVGSWVMAKHKAISALNHFFIHPDRNSADKAQLLCRTKVLSKKYYHSITTDARLHRDSD